MAKITLDVPDDVAEQLKEKGKVTRGWLGVVVQEVTRDLAKSFGATTALAGMTWTARHGQVTAMLSHQGVDVGVTDLPWMPHLDD